MLKPQSFRLASPPGLHTRALPWTRWEPKVAPQTPHLLVVQPLSENMATALICIHVFGCHWYLHAAVKKKYHSPVDYTIFCSKIYCKDFNIEESPKTFTEREREREREFKAYSYILLYSSQISSLTIGI